MAAGSSCRHGGEGRHAQPPSLGRSSRPRPYRSSTPHPARGALPGTDARVADGLVSRPAPAAQAATLPAGFQESIVFSGLTNPTVVRFARDGRVFVAEKRGVIKVFDSLTDTTPDVFADLQRQRLQLLGPRPARHGARPRTSRPTPTSTSSTPTTTSSARPPRRRAGARPAVYSDPCPTPPGADRRRLRGQRAALAPAGRRQRDDRRRAGAGRGLVPAVPQPLGRRRGVRARRRPLRQRRRRRQLQLRRLRPGRQPAQPVRRPAGRRRRRP